MTNQAIVFAYLPSFKGEKLPARQPGNKDEYKSLAQVMESARYRIEPQKESLSTYEAVNDSQNFAATFTSAGINLQIESSGEKSALSWKLKSYGYEKLQFPVSRGVIKTEKQRAEIFRSEDGLTEWFENKPEGLEQGFILARKPAINDGQSAKLRFILQAGGQLRPRLTQDGQSVELISKNGKDILRYEKLRAWDNTGMELGASLQAVGNEVWIDVDETGAAYPITIDPTFVQSQKVTGRDGEARDLFGKSVAISGNTAIIGAPGANIGGVYQQGAAYVFVRNGNSWIEQAKLVANDGHREFGFGTSVAISGDIALIGAPYDDLPNYPGGCAFPFPTACDFGSAYIFVRNGNTWTQQQKIISPDPARLDSFGQAVTVDGNTAVIGEPGNNNGIKPLANVYVNNGTTWALEQRLSGDNQPYSSLGESVAINNGTVIIGAFNGGTQGDGEAFVYVRNAAVWELQQKLMPTDSAPGPAFGDAVAIAGDTAVVTTSGTEAANHIGAAYVFVRSGTTWSQRQKLTAVDGEPIDHFGYSVAISGGTIVVGSPYDRVGLNDFQGSAYVFSYNGASWIQQQKLTAIDGGYDALFGSSVAVSGDTIIAGAQGGSEAGANSEIGTAYMFTSLPAKQAPFDFDGDGKTDISVFRPSSGFWYLLRSSNNQFQAVNFGLGSDIIAPADFDGDGRTDISVFRPSDGVWYRINSSNGTFQAMHFGQNGDVPVPADFDGDARADLSVFRPLNGMWYRLNSLTGNFVAIQLGANGDIPIPADFDGDLRADINVFRPSNGTWYRINSSNNNSIAMQFGQIGDIPVPADYDGDRRADINVFRPSNGIWYRINSSPGCVGAPQPKTNENNLLAPPAPGCFVATQFGMSGDYPTVGDFDGDRKADISVFRPSVGTWYWLNANSRAIVATRFGTSEDRSVPSSFGQF